jgi:hypothetical protein
MPSPQHEAILTVFRVYPELVPWLLRHVFHLALPDYDDVYLTDTGVPRSDGNSLTADNMIVFRNAGRDVLGTVVETQLDDRGRGRRGRAKKRTWKAYVAQLELDHEIGVLLLVLVPDIRVARWAARPLGGPTSLPLRHYVLSPLNLPPVRDLDQARDLPFQTLLAAMLPRQARPADEQQDGADEDDPAARADGPDGKPDEGDDDLLPDTRDDPGVPDIPLLPVYEALLAVADTLSERYLDIMVAGLSPRTGTQLREHVMSVTAAEGHRSDLLRALEARGEARGEVRGEARSLLRVLDRRGVQVTDAFRTRALTCTDTDQLEQWLDRAATANSLEDVTQE